MRTESSECSFILLGKRKIVGDGNILMYNFSKEVKIENEKAECNLQKQAKALDPKSDNNQVIYTYSVNWIVRFIYLQFFGLHLTLPSQAVSNFMGYSLGLLLARIRSPDSLV
jgi:hypothetical protein